MRKRIYLVVFTLYALKINLQAQVPNFGTTIGDQKLYGYSALKFKVEVDT